MVQGGSEAGEAIRLHVGTYASAGGRGLYPLTWSPERGWAVGEPDDAVVNASFGVHSRRFGLHYLVDEQRDGTVAAYRRIGTGWAASLRLPTGGAEPCHAALDPDETCLAVANYGSGSIALFRLDGHSGLPVEPPVIHLNQGHGVDPERQEGPHAHCVVFSPDRRWLFQTDLGTDEILAFPVDRTRGMLGTPRTAFRGPPGSGPRTLCLHPHLPKAFLVSELASTVTVLDIGDVVLTGGQVISTIPEGISGRNLGGHVAVNQAGDRLYVTNRGHDSIAVFSIGDDGALTSLQHVPSAGASPRFFLLIERHRRLVLANEEGGNVVVFCLANDGTVTRKEGDVTVPGAAFLFEE